jgi:hypothetical protein
METTVTNSSTPTPKPSVLDRLRVIFGGEPADGSFGSKIKAEGALDVVRSGANGAWQRAGGEVR